MFEGQQIDSDLADQLMQLWGGFFNPQGLQHLGRGQLEVAPRFIFTGSVIPMGWCLPKTVSEQLQQVYCAHKADKARQHEEPSHVQRHGSSKFRSWVQSCLQSNDAPADRGERRSKKVEHLMNRL